MTTCACDAPGSGGGSILDEICVTSQGPAASERLTSQGITMKLVLILGLSALTAQTAHAEPFQKLADGAVLHTASGWTFPQSIGDFQRVGDPQGIAGTPDGVANYEFVVNGNKQSATVYVYPPDSRAEEDRKS